MIVSRESGSLSPAEKSRRSTCYCSCPCPLSNGPEVIGQTERFEYIERSKREAVLAVATDAAHAVLFGRNQQRLQLWTTKKSSTQNTRFAPLVFIFVLGVSCSVVIVCSPSCFYLWRLFLVLVVMPYKSIRRAMFLKSFKIKQLIICAWCDRYIYLSGVLPRATSDRKKCYLGKQP